MVVFFCVFAGIIVLSVVFLSGKMALLSSPDRKTVYELRVHDGKLQHALRHGGVQLFSWSDIILSDADGIALPPKKVKVIRNNAKTGEFEIDVFEGTPRLFVRVTDAFVASAFYDLPEEKRVSEFVEIRPEAGARGTQFSQESVAKLDAPRNADERPFVFIAPKADGGETFLVYQPTETAEAAARPSFVYDFKNLAEGRDFSVEKTYAGTQKNGNLHVLYFSDSPALLREFYTAGVPVPTFPSLEQHALADDAEADALTEANAKKSQ